MGQRHESTVGALYRFPTEESLDYIGSCWMKGRVKTTDLLLCVDHSGDCFCDYVILEEGTNGFEAVLKSEFGAYDYTEKLSKAMPKKQFHRLMGGIAVLLKDMPKFTYKHRGEFGDSMYSVEYSEEKG